MVKEQLGPQELLRQKADLVKSPPQIEDYNGLLTERLIESLYNAEGDSGAQDKQFVAELEKLEVSESEMQFALLWHILGKREEGATNNDIAELLYPDEYDVHNARKKVVARTHNLKKKFRAHKAPFEFVTIIKPVQGKTPGHYRLIFNENIDYSEENSDNLKEKRETFDRQDNIIKILKETPMTPSALEFAIALREITKNGRAVTNRELAERLFPGEVYDKKATSKITKRARELRRVLNESPLKLISEPVDGRVNPWRRSIGFKDLDKASNNNEDDEEAMINVEKEEIDTTYTISLYESELRAGIENAANTMIYQIMNRVKHVLLMNESKNFPSKKEGFMRLCFENLDEKDFSRLRVTLERQNRDAFSELLNSFSKQLEELWKAQKKPSSGRIGEISEGIISPLKKRWGVKHVDIVASVARYFDVEMPEQYKNTIPRIIPLEGVREKETPEKVLTEKVLRGEKAISANIVRETISKERLEEKLDNLADQAAKLIIEEVYISVLNLTSFIKPAPSELRHLLADSLKTNPREIAQVIIKLQRDGQTLPEKLTPVLAWKIKERFKDSKKGLGQKREEKVLQDKINLLKQKGVDADIIVMSAVSHFGLERPENLKNDNIAPISLSQHREIPQRRKGKQGKSWLK